ncbi:unnamed protein product [Diamesa serratosioi]
MSKPEQLLIIEPSQELKFRGPFIHPVTSHMSLKNPTDRKILFKIKTTAPKKYCVRPNCGAIEAKSSIEIAICLQPFVFDPNEKNKHKFMVQSLVAPDGEINAEQLWKDISPEQLMDSKLRCLFDMPVEKSKADGTSVSQSTSNESLNSSSSVGDNIQRSGNDSDFIRATAEVRELREEGSQLRQDNIELKEQILRLKSVVDSKSDSSAAPSVKSFQNPYSPPQMAQQQLPIVYVIAAVAMAIFGLILGKFVL